MSSIPSWGLHWFRRDLRIVDNQALRENWKQNQGRTLGIFCFDSQFLSRTDFSHNRFAFFMKTLQSVRDDLQSKGGDLLVIDAMPEDAFGKLFEYFQKRKIAMPTTISWSRDYEPYARERDKIMQDFFGRNNISVITERDHLFFEPHEVLKDDGTFYQVFTPYCRTWFSQIDSKSGSQRLELQSRSEGYFNSKSQKTDLFKLKWSEISLGTDFPFSDSLSKFVEQNQKKVTIVIPEAGFNVAYKQFENFKNHVDDYKTDRDLPWTDGTSRLSHFFKNGSLTVSQVIAQLKPKHWHSKRDDGMTKYIKELVWREFYYSILFHRPDVEKTCFHKNYEAINWENNEVFFQKWKDGTTGFPIVDAGMRQLKTTGWMHNRVRMIVASFLTKDLLIDWKWGENYFMQELLDGDLACNNGGWQWAASTGCDPQPYFRIFNPWLQGEKFDPDGLYIKKFIPELAKVPAKALHDPKAERAVGKYPKPIVDHSVQRDKALELYKQVR